MRQSQGQRFPLRHSTMTRRCGYQPGSDYEVIWDPFEKAVGKKKRKRELNLGNLQVYTWQYHKPTLLLRASLFVPVSQLSGSSPAPFLPAQPERSRHRLEMGIRRKKKKPTFCNSTGSTWRALQQALTPTSDEEKERYTEQLIAFRVLNCDAIW